MANETVIEQRPDGKWDARIALADGRSFEIEGLLEWRFALAWSHMHLSWQGGGHY